MVQELEKTMNCFDISPHIKKDAGCCTTDEDDQEVIIEASSPWKDLWDKELANYVTEKDFNNKLQGKDKQNKYFMDSYYYRKFRSLFLFIPMWSNICNSS